MNEKLKEQLLQHEKVCSAYSLNRNLPIFKLSKLFFLQHIIPFLDEEEIIVLSSTCKIFNTLIYNSLTFKFLLSESYPSKYYQTHFISSHYSNQPLYEEKRFETSDDDNDYIVQLESLRHLNDFMGQKALTLENVVRNNTKEIAQLINELIAAKERNKKSTERILSLERQIKAIEVVKQDHGETINELNKNYQTIVRKKYNKNSHFFKLTEKEQNISHFQEENKRLIEQKEHFSKEVELIS